MELSSRLKIIASFVSEGMCVADIGTDHGYIPIYLTSEGMTDKAYAMDVNRGPLERASENIRKEGLNGKIRCILSDGMEKLPMDADSAVIAGMGRGQAFQAFRTGSFPPVPLGESQEIPAQPWVCHRKRSIDKGRREILYCHKGCQGPAILRRVLAVFLRHLSYRIKRSPDEGVPDERAE